MTSLRVHLTRRIAAGTFLVAASGLLIVFVYLRFELLEQFDNTLISRARTLGSLVRVDNETGGLEFELTERAMAEYRPSRRPDYFQVWDQSGGVVARSTSLQDTDLPRAPADTALDDRKRYFYLTLPDGRAGRAVEFLVDPAHADEQYGVTPAPSDAAPTSPPKTGPVTLVLATDLAELNEAFRHTLAVCALVIAAVSVGTMLTVKSMVRRGLRPLQDIGEAVARLGPATLNSRFEVGPLPEELRPISEKLNELLARIEAAFQRERRFTSNVAHELRTPIAELRSLAEVALRWPGDADATRGNSGDVLNVSRQMESVVTALLAIARCQAGQQPLAFRPVPLADVVAEAWRPHAAAARARNLHTRLDDIIPATISSDRTVLAAMLGNLFANAVTYATEGGQVECRGQTAEDGRYALQIMNSDESLTEADLRLLTEPFWRKDASRTDSTNSGLGLALVETYARLLQVDFNVALRHQNLFVVTLKLPLTAKSSAQLDSTDPCEIPAPSQRALTEPQNALINSANELGA